MQTQHIPWQFERPTCAVFRACARASTGVFERVQSCACVRFVRIKGCPDLSNGERTRHAVGTLRHGIQLFADAQMCVLVTFEGECGRGGRQERERDRVAKVAIPHQQLVHADSKFESNGHHRVLLPN